MTKRKLEIKIGIIQRDIRVKREKGLPYNLLEKRLNDYVDRLVIEHFMRGIHYFNTIEKE